MILTSEKIHLRPFKSEDLNTLHEWRNDPEIRELAMQHPYPISCNLDANWLESVLTDVSNKKIIWAVETLQDKKLIGYFQLLDINLIHRNAMLGIIIGDKQSRGKGYGEQVILLGVNWAFENIGLKKISLDVLEGNLSAINLYRKLGFVEEGMFLKHFYSNGKYHNVKRMAKYKIN